MTTERNTAPQRRRRAPAEPRASATQRAARALGLPEVRYLKAALKVADLPLLNPRQIDARLLDLGYRGQPDARRAGAVLAYQHLARLRRVWCEQRDPTELSRQPHALVVGPSGCGKTYLVELLFRDILGVPTVVVDATRFTEAGYVGDDVPGIMTRLLLAAGGDPAWAACGVVCIDEIDKLGGGASKQGRDVSGAGVQRELLTLLSGKATEVPPALGMDGRREKPLHLPLATTTFIGAGAFSNAQEAHRGGTIGFSRGERPPPTRHGTLPTDPAELRDVMRQEGIMPELLGRFSRVVRLDQLAEGELTSILRETMLPRHQREFAEEGIGLNFTEAAVRGLVSEALRENLGARSLASQLAEPLERVAFETFGRDAPRDVTLTWRNGQIAME